MNFICLVMLYGLTQIDSTVTDESRFNSTHEFASLIDMICTKMACLLDLDRSASVFESIKFYFAYITFVTFYYALKLWQRKNCRNEDQPTTPPSIIFKDISRKNSDESLMNLFKYCVNYGFYKFGIEITLIMFIIVFFTRLDVFTIFYSFWFLLLVFRNREKAEKLWIVATTSVCVSLFVQCCIVAVLFVVDKQQLVNMGSYKITKEYIDPLHKHPQMMISDFILLMLMSSQVCLFFKLSFLPSDSDFIFSPASSF